MTNNALFELLLWATESLKRIEFLPQDCYELDLKIDLLNLVSDVAQALNNPGADVWPITEEAEDIAQRLLVSEEEFMNLLIEKVRGF